MADRKAELARKKAKLEEMRRIRDMRDGASETAPSASSASSAVESESVSDLVSSILGESASPKKTPSVSVAGSVPSTPSVRASSKPTKSSLSVSEIKSLTIAPAEMVSYSKGVQTDSVDGIDSRAETTSDISQDTVNLTKVETIESPVEAVKQEAPQPVALTEAQIAAVFDSADFQHFFDRSTRIVERALHERYDVAVDYTQNDNDNDTSAASSSTVSVAAEFFDSRYSANRTVTCIDWSSKHPELFIAGYTANPEATNDPDGIVLTWNVHMPDRPEFVFEHQSAILSACFARFHPNFVLGGSYSGQVVLWDNRAKRTPVQRSSLSSKAHTHPVFCMEVVGTQNAHNLVTVSSDGKLCVWNLDMLKEPIECYSLQSGTKAVAASCFSFPLGDTGSFVAASEDGTLYPFTRNSGKADCGEPMLGHNGPITGVDIHKCGGPVDFSNLILTASADWSVKLWQSGKSAASAHPIHSFEETGDYLYDVKWSPAHPSVFASCDGLGRVDLWNINQDTEIPVVRTVLGEGKTALNCLKFNRNGTQLATGALDGRVHVLNLSEKLVVPRQDEWSRLKNTLTELQIATAELQTDTTDSSVSGILSSTAASTASSAAAVAVA